MSEHRQNMNIFQATKYQIAPYPGKRNCCFFVNYNYSFSLAIDKIWDTQSQNYPLCLTTSNAQQNPAFLNPP